MYFLSFLILDFIRVVVADNHSANENTFNFLIDKFERGKKYYITIPNSHNYSSFDNTYIKNIQISLLSWKKFVFPSFTFEISNIHISSVDGYIAWSDIQKIYDQDRIIETNLRKALKLILKALRPRDIK